MGCNALSLRIVCIVPVSQMSISVQKCGIVGTPYQSKDFMKAVLKISGRWQKHRAFRMTRPN